MKTLSGSLNAYRARVDGRHAIEIDAPGDAFDQDNGGVAAENFSARARMILTNEPLSLLYSTGVPILLISFQASTLVRSWFRLSGIGPSSSDLELNLGATPGSRSIRASPPDGGCR